MDGYLRTVTRTVNEPEREYGVCVIVERRGRYLEYEHVQVWATRPQLLFPTWRR